jgi:multisubunit Na+/H+ antiporter MnhG subunit
VSKWQIVGVLLILLGVAVLVLMGGFIIHIIETLLKLIAVLIGILMIAAGVALLVGRRWMRGRGWRWGPVTSST